MENNQIIQKNRCQKWRFVNQRKVPFGKSVYVLGNLPQLGAWNLKDAIRMEWTEGDNWVKEIDLNIQKQVEYKYIEAKYESVLDGTIWEDGINRKLDLSIIRENFPHILTIMSFNIRYDNPQDAKFSWPNRKQNCVKMILGLLPSVLGLQEVLPSQRNYLKEELKGSYSYVGIPRDLGSGEEVGMFYLTNRFKLIQSGFVWYSESRRPGVIGYDCKLPRNFTYLILQDQNDNQVSLIINTHFDNISRQSQKNSVYITLDSIQNLMKQDRKYRKKHIQNIFIIGDFNVDENDKIFEKFYENQSFNFKSCRATAELSDQSNTFHHFEGEKFDLNVKIDHIFYHSKRRAVSFRVIKTHNINPPYLSDHYPIIGEFIKVQ